MRSVSDKPIMIKPNAGQPQLINGKQVWLVTPEEFAEEAPRWIEAGANILSGCCGSGPEHIAAVVAALKKFKP